MNKVAIDNVQTILVVKMVQAENSAKKAKEEGMTDICVQMHEDEAKIYSELLEYINKSILEIY